MEPFGMQQAGRGMPRDISLVQRLFYFKLRPLSLTLRELEGICVIVLRSVDLWVRKCVKSRASLVHRRARLLPPPAI